MNSHPAARKPVTRKDRPWTEHYDPGVPPSIEYPDHTLHAFLVASSQKYPHHACTILGNAVTTYREMNTVTDRIAGTLAAMGVKKGDRVGILMPNIPQFVMTFYGILKAGAVVVATNPLYTPGEIAHQANDSGIEVMFVASGQYQILKASQGGTGIKRLIVVRPEDGLPQVAKHYASDSRGGDRDAESAGGRDARDTWLQDLLDHHQEADPPDLHIGPDDTALFQYSGGTTGISKAAVASHRGVVANTMQFRRWLVTLKEGNETVLMAIPLYHAYGLIAGMSLGISLGASLALVPNARDLPSLLDTINKHRPTVFPGVPTLYNAIGNHPDVISGRVDLASIRVCISGSTALMRETKDRFEHLSGGRICEGYGLSEAPVVTHCNPLLGTNKIGSIGMPMPDVECRIVDPDNGERDVEPGESGELLLRGPQLMKGYHNMPAETAVTLRVMRDGKTWLFTGDIVRMDEDGYFYVVDRKKELIKPGGFQVWPREVEEVLAAHPAVLEAGVAGVPDPDRGEAVKAWVVLRPEAQASVDEISEWCRARLAPYKVPAQIVFRSHLPKSNVGKVLRRELVREHRELGGANT